TDRHESYYNKEKEQHRRVLCRKRRKVSCRFRNFKSPIMEDALTPFFTGRRPFTGSRSSSSATAIMAVKQTLTLLLHILQKMESEPSALPFAAEASGTEADLPQ